MTDQTEIEILGRAAEATLEATQVLNDLALKLRQRQVYGVLEDQDEAKRRCAELNRLRERTIRLSFELLMLTKEGKDDESDSN